MRMGPGEQKGLGELGPGWEIWGLLIFIHRPLSYRTGQLTFHLLPLHLFLLFLLLKCVILMPNL